MSKYSGIVAAIIVIVAVVFLLIWATMHRLSRRNDDDEERTEHAAGGSSQGQYMREVRIRQQEDLAAVTYGGKDALVSLQLNRRLLMVECSGM